MNTPTSPFSDPANHSGNSDLNSAFSSMEGVDHTVFNEHFLLQALYNNTVSVHCLLDKDMNILWANSVAQDEIKKRFGRYIAKGETILNFTAPYHHEEFKEKIKKVLQGVSIAYDRHIKMPDGSQIWTTITLQPLFDPRGNLIAISFQGVDNTERQLSQDKMKEAQQTLAVLFDSLAQTYVLFDLDRKISWFNLSASEESLYLFGGKMELGGSYKDVVPKEFLPFLDTVFTKAAQGETVSYERQYTHLPGVWRQLVMGPVKDSSGTIIGTYLTSKDISELKQALQNSMYNEYKMRAIFDTSTDIHALFSEDNKLIWANKETIRITPRLFGEELKLGIDIGTFIAPEHREAFYESLEKVKSGATLNYERLYHDINGTPVWLNVTICTVQYSEDQSKQGISFTIKDITHQKQYEERLTQVNKELTEQIQQLNQFSYIVSHNLRGPVASLMGLTNLLEKELGNDKHKEVVEGYRITVNRFDEIINDLTKILTQTNEADKTRSVISPQQEFSKVLDLQRTYLDQIHAEVYTDFSDDQIMGIKSFVNSIFLNLLTNAIKYRKHEGQLKIQVRTSKYKDKIMLEFSDNGMGIDLELYQDKLFNFYKRFHDHVDGKGLGLYLVKTQVELMGGKIEVKSKVGEGTTFFVYLPRA